MDLDKINTLAILGDRNSAKTNLLIYLMKEYKGEKKKYLLGYPKELEGFEHINTLNELSQLTNALVGIDEIQRVTPFYQKRANDILLELLSTMVHNDNTIIFTTCLTQFIVKALDGFIEGFCYTRITDLGSLKNGSKAKRRLLEFRHPKVNNWSLNLANGEYLEVIDNTDFGCNGIKIFPDMNIKKDWKC